MGNCLQNAAGEFSEWNQELRRGSGAAVLTFEIGSTAEATLGGDQGEDLAKGRVDGDRSGTVVSEVGPAAIVHSRLAAPISTRSSAAILQHLCSPDISRDN